MGTSCFCFPLVGILLGKLRELQDPNGQNGGIYVYIIVLIFSIMNIDYSYFKRRGLFGSPIQFVNDGPTILESFPPDKALASTYLTKNPVDKSTQESPIMSLHEANTWRTDFTDRGMFHDQGGWPKDLNILDDEAVLRFRKKLEREDNYIASMKALTKPIEHAILQNNAINIYEMYFDDTLKEYSVSESLSQIRNIYRDPKSTEIARPVSHVSWSPEKSTFAASYCNMKFQMRSSQESSEAYIWRVEIPSAPETIFDSKMPIVNIEWNPNDHNLLIGGMLSGQIAYYDVRKAPDHVDITPPEVSHREPVHSLLWINSKSGVEFFSTSADGVVKWWDCRYLTRVTDSIILDISRSQNMVNAFGASCLEYDSSIPAKYLVGTETGHVICGNRKGTSVVEKLPWVLKAHTGPIYSVMRNPAFTKMIMTVGDWNVRIWSEDCKESAVIWTKNYKVNLTCGEWSKSRYSVFCVTRSDGYLDLWDVLLDQRSPFVSIRVNDRPLTTLRMEEQGQFVVAGDESGKCHLIQYGESLTTCAKNDKNNLAAMFDRESRREKILEGRMREIRLAMRLKAQTQEAKSDVYTEESKLHIGEALLKVEEEYWEGVRTGLSKIEESKKEKTEKKEEVEEKAPTPVPPPATPPLEQEPPPPAPSP